MTPLISATIDSVFGSPALDAGINAGDKIVKVNSDNIKTWTEFTDWISNNDDDVISATLERGNSIYETTIERNDDGTIGVAKLYTGIEPVHRDLSLSESIVEGFDYGYWTLYDYVCTVSICFH